MRRSVLILLLNIALAVLYTTPWDNYLVATRVWWYNPGQVNGLTLGYVPIEEYLFFILQSSIVGLWILLVYDITGELGKPAAVNVIVRWISSAFLLLIGSGSLYLLISEWDYGRYFSLILIWCCLPLLIQLAFGADFLWARWRSLSLVIIPPTIYLWVMDAISIRQGIWTINPQNIIGWGIGQLPVEEMLFFLVTNILIGFGMTLFLIPESYSRAGSIFTRLRLIVNDLR